MAMEYECEMKWKMKYDCEIEWFVKWNESGVGWNETKKWNEILDYELQWM